MTQETRPTLEQQVRNKTEFVHRTSRMIYEMHRRWIKLLTTDPVRVVTEFLSTVESHRILALQARHELIARWGYDPVSGAWLRDPPENMLADPGPSRVWIQFHASDLLRHTMEVAREGTQDNGWEFVPSLTFCIDQYCHTVENMPLSLGLLMKHELYEGQAVDIDVLISAYVRAHTSLARNPSLRTALTKNGENGDQQLLDQLPGAVFETWMDRGDNGVRTGDTKFIVDWIESNVPTFVKQVQDAVTGKEPKLGFQNSLTARDLNAIPDTTDNVRDDEFFAREEARRQYEQRATADVRSSLPRYLQPIYDDMQNKRSVKETAARHGIAEGTVKGYRADIRKMLAPAASDILGSA